MVTWRQDKNMKKIIFFLVILNLVFLPIVETKAGNSLSMDFEASNLDHFTVGDTASADITSNITMEAWIKIESQPTGQFNIINKMPVVANGYRLFYFSDAGTLKIRAQLGDGSTSNSFDLTITLALDTWYYLVFTWESASSIGRTYVNGDQRASTAGTISAIANNTEILRISADAGGNEGVDGLLDEVKIWARELTADQVRTNQFKSSTAMESGLNGYWKFDGDRLDSSLNGNTLTPVNTPIFSGDVPFRDKKITYFSEF